MQNVMTHTDPVTCGTQHESVQYDPPSYSNLQLSTSLTDASALVQGDIQDASIPMSLPIYGGVCVSVSYSYSQPSMSFLM